jgi:glycosyltransferase involved in cell wall biosynthesis
MNILFIAPLTNKHGQGVVSLKVLEILHEKHRIHAINTHTNSTGIVKVIFNAILLFKLIFHLFFIGYGYIYFTPSRNRLSSLKDFLILKFSPQTTFVCGHLHGSDLNSFLNSSGLYGRTLFKLYIDNLNRMLILSSSHVKYALGEHYDNYQVISNFSSIANLKSKNISSEFNNAYFVSVPHPDKGLDDAIDVFHRLKQNSVVDNLDVIGWTRKDYHRIYTSKEQNINDVNFHGFLTHEQQPGIIGKGSLLIFPTRYRTEAQPLVVIEALLNGKVVLTTKWKMMRDFAISKNVYYLEDIELDKFKIAYMKDQEAEDHFSYKKFEEGVLGCFD